MEYFINLYGEHISKVIIKLLLYHPDGHISLVYFYLQKIGQNIKRKKSET